MIELINQDRCTSCNICVEVCPTNVFARDDTGPPVIARQSDCQTCYMCELYCPEDALFVAPSASPTLHMTPDDAYPMLGSYRQSIGWTSTTRALRQTDASYVLLAQVR